MTKSKKSSNERRLFDRLQFESNVQLFSGTTAWSCKMIDISLKGVLFSKPDNWDGKINDNFRLNISQNNSLSISMRIEIAHIGEKTIGAEWSKIDVGSFSQLKRFLELNTLVRNKISKEISFL